MIDSTLLDVRRQGKHGFEPGSEVEDSKIYGDDDDQKICIGIDLDPSDKVKLKNLMEQYRDIFAWLLADIQELTSVWVVTSC